MTESHVCGEHLDYIGGGSYPWECVVCGRRLVARDLEPQGEGWVAEARRERLGRHEVLSEEWLGELVDIAESTLACACGAEVLSEAVLSVASEVRSLRERLGRAEALEAEAAWTVAELEAGAEDLEDRAAFEADRADFYADEGARLEGGR